MVKDYVKDAEKAGGYGSVFAGEVGGGDGGGGGGNSGGDSGGGGGGDEDGPESPTTPSRQGPDRLLAECESPSNASLVSG